MNDSLAPRTAGQMSHQLLQFSCTCGSFSNEGLFKMITDISHLETMHRDQNIVLHRQVFTGCSIQYSIYIQYISAWMYRAYGKVR